MNKCLFIGRLTADPVKKEFDWGMIVTFTLAIDRKYKNKDGTKTTDFIDFKAKNKMAEIIAEYHKKGDLVSVISEVQKSKYEKDGETRYATNFIVSESQNLQGKKKLDRDNTVIEDEPPF